MFERYTEKARRVIFFARYEASTWGSPYVEPEHILLGVLREDKALTNRLLHSHAAVESIRKQIEERTPVREKTFSAVDLPLSKQSKDVLVYATEEADHLGSKHIGTPHLVLGLLREAGFAASLLKEQGVELDAVQKSIAQSPQVPETEGASEDEMSKRFEETKASLLRTDWMLNGPCIHYAYTAPGVRRSAFIYPAKLTPEQREKLQLAEAALLEFADEVEEQQTKIVRKINSGDTAK